MSAERLAVTVKELGQRFLKRAVDPFSRQHPSRSTALKNLDGILSGPARTCQQTKKVLLGGGRYGEVVT